MASYVVRRADECPHRRQVGQVGAEGTGLPAGAYRYLDRKLTIPMRAPVESLNAAVAVALLLYSPSLRAGTD